MSDDDLDAIQKKIFGWVIVAVLGGNAGFILNAVSPETRNDPFTGTEGAAMELRLDRIDAEQQKMIYRMGKIEAWGEKCRDRVNEHLRNHN